MRCDAMRCDAMRRDATRCNAMQQSSHTRVDQPIGSEAQSTRDVETAGPQVLKHRDEIIVASIPALFATQLANDRHTLEDTRARVTRMVHLS
jgi:predicted dinucleotide-utilizing enzyme